LNYTAFISELELLEYSPATVKAYRGDLQHFSEFLQRRKLRLSQVTPEVAGAYRDEMRSSINRQTGAVGLSPATIDRRLASVSSFFEHLRRRDPRRINPVEALQVFRSRTKRIQDHQGKAVDERALNALMKGIDNPRDRAMFSLFLTSGLRLHELAQLNVDSITEVLESDSDGSARTYGTGTVVGKGSKERRFYFDSETVHAIADYLAGRSNTSLPLFLSERGTRLSERSIQDTLARWCKRLGLSPLHIHQLRHTFATRLANANIDALVLRDLMGHSRFETTTRYFRLAEDNKARQYFAAMESISNSEL
jgi:integrase/recombinase XerC